MLGKFLSNIYDHRLPDARKNYFPTRLEPGQIASIAMDVEWERHLAWIGRNVIGPPKATGKYSQEQLEAHSLIGIYAESEVQDDKATIQI